VAKQKKRMPGHRGRRVAKQTKRIPGRPTDVAGPLVRWLNVNVIEWLCAWSHVKDVRVFRESVLRLVNLYIGRIGHLWQLSLSCISVELSCVDWHSSCAVQSKIMKSMYCRYWLCDWIQCR
jgi:hypothetical protein